MSESNSSKSGSTKNVATVKRKQNTKWRTTQNVAHYTFTTPTHVVSWSETARNVANFPNHSQRNRRKQRRINQKLKKKLAKISAAALSTEASNNVQNKDDENSNVSVPPARKKKLAKITGAASSTESSNNVQSKDEQNSNVNVPPVHDLNISDERAPPPVVNVAQDQQNC